jgi:hypothetical protein
MRRFRILLTVILGILVAIDAIVGYRLWESGWPKHIGLTSPQKGVEQVRVTAVPFTGPDWVILILLIGVHALLFCLVRKAWRSGPVRV